MIEIIERGTLPENIVREVRCRHCSSRLRFKSTDATYMADSRDGDYFLIKCPVCSNEITKSV